MATILAFAGSNSTTSINFKLVKYTVSLIVGHDVQILNMANFPFPMYSEDYEKENGFSNSLIELKNDITHANAIVISVNEHNSNPSAYFKNLIDWLSRLEQSFISNKKVFLLSTSPGKRGGIGAQEVVNNMLTRFGAEITATFSLPSFYDNYDAEKGISEPELSKAYQKALDSFLAKI
jgi:NAD(P)H-dependent FMN reductase